MSITVPSGQSMALIGHNGSGKSTFLRMVAGLLDASGGEIEIAGFELSDVEARATTSFLPDDPVLYDDLSLREHAEYISKLHGGDGWDDYADFYDWENARTLGRREILLDRPIDIGQLIDVHPLLGKDAVEQHLLLDVLLGGAVGGELSSVLPFHAPAGVGTYPAGIAAGAVAFGAARSGPSFSELLQAAVNGHLLIVVSALAATALALPLSSRKRPSEG